MTDGFLYLSDVDLAGLGISAREIVDSLDHALAASRGGTVWTAPKSVILPGDGRYMMSTLSASDDPGMLVAKAVALNPRNGARRLQTINGAIIVLDSETGLLRAVLDAAWITGVRTAGLSAVAARRLADPASRRIGFVGCGVQARSHLEIFGGLFPLAEVVAFGRGEANIRRLGEEAAARNLRYSVAASPQDTLDGTDIVVSSITATYDGSPFLDAARLKPGAFVSSTDLALPWEPASLAALDAIVVDDLEQERAMMAPLVDPALVKADLKTLAAGDTPLAFDQDKRTALVSRGIAVGDLAVAALAVGRAEATQTGTPVGR